jgi:hypothetical protein
MGWSWLWAVRVWWVRWRRERGFLPPPVRLEDGDGAPFSDVYSFRRGREWARADHTGRVFRTGVIVGGQHVPDEVVHADRWLVKVTR